MDHHKVKLDDEIQAVIKRLKNNKTPGPDGYPVEFLKTFADLLLPAMKKTYDYILQRGVLFPSWNEAVLIPIIKPGKAPQQCSPYRSTMFPI